MRKKQHMLYLILGVVCFFISGGIIVLTDPHTLLLPGSPVTAVPFFFCLLAVSIYSITFYITRAKKHALLLSTFVIVYLLLRLYELHHPIFLLLLAALFLMLELFFVYRPPSK